MMWVSSAGTPDQNVKTGNRRTLSQVPAAFDWQCEVRHNIQAALSAKKNKNTMGDQQIRKCQRYLCKWRVTLTALPDTFAKQSVSGVKLSLSVLTAADAQLRKVSSYQLEKMLLCIPMAATVSAALCLCCNWLDQWHLLPPLISPHKVYRQCRRILVHTEELMYTDRLRQAHTPQEIHIQTHKHRHAHTRRWSKQLCIHFFSQLVSGMAATFLSFSILLRSNTNTHTFSYDYAL